jgi:hypothetical protein
MKMTLTKTYKIQKGPNALDLQKYVELQNKEYKNLLDSSKSERDIQCFFERNPSFVPGAWTPGIKSGHYPLHCALITQPKLIGLRTKIPDFMWISTHSGGWYPTLVEIEKPSKNIFTKKGEPTADFSQARNQLEKWKTWFNNPSNLSLFIKMYQIPDYMVRMRQMKLRMILVYGRRVEFESDPEKSRERMSLISSLDYDLMSYDRISCDRDLEDAITIKLNKSGRYTAVAIPPTFTLGPALADRLIHIDGIDSALDKTIGISNRRRAFLKKRLLYWQGWAKQSEYGAINMGDRE